DGEGAEYFILGPFLREARGVRWPSRMIVEDGSGRWQVDLAALVQEAGYRIVAKTKLNYVFERT
ncbi:MAG: FkbM family methyltransferase, partial [Salinarimonas sp.]